MENSDTGDTVHLPSYGLDVLDQAAKEIYEEAGFKVDTVGQEPISHDGKEVYPMISLTDKGGALRCLAQVIQREH